MAGPQALPALVFSWTHDEGDGATHGKARHATLCCLLHLCCLRYASVGILSLYPFDPTSDDPPWASQ